MKTGEPDELKGSRPVRWGVLWKSAALTVTRQVPTQYGDGKHVRYRHCLRRGQGAGG